jgi:hypothetical protein
VQKTAYLDGDVTNKKLPFVYSVNADGTNNPLVSAQLLLNGYTRFDTFGKIILIIYNRILTIQEHQRMV